MRAAEETTGDRPRRRGLIILAVVVVILLAGVWLLSRSSPEEWASGVAERLGVEVGLAERHYVPADFVGWGVTTFEVEGGPELEQVEGALIFRYPEHGKIETSSPRNAGMKQQEFFSLEDGGPRSLAVGGRLPAWMTRRLPTERAVWHTFDGSVRVVSGAGEMKHLYWTGFFVGTKDQYEAEGPIHTVMPRLIEELDDGPPSLE